MLTLPNFSTLFVSTLVVFFVVGSWLNLSGVWIEFPLIVDELPEGWRLPAVMGLIANLANIGIVFVAIIRRFSHGRVFYEIPVNIFILTTGTVVLILLAFFWNKTTMIGGSARSSYLMGFSLSLSLVDCTSSVTFLPFLDRYEPIFINAYFLGESLSSLFPALLGIAQGVGRTSCIVGLNGTVTEFHAPPRFSVRIYFLALAGIMFVSLFSFVILCLTRMGRRKDLTDVQKSNNFLVDDPQMSTKEFWWSKHGIYLFLCFWTSLLIIGATPSLQSFSLYPYSIEVYHHTIVACQFAYPLMSFLGAFVPQVRSRTLYFLTLIGTGLFAYAFIAAKLSPCSPFVDRLSGRVIIALVWVAKYCVLYYIRVVLGNYFRRKSGHRGLFWFGILTQIGSLVGAVAIYIFTEHFLWFRERSICVNYFC